MKPNDLRSGVAETARDPSRAQGRPELHEQHLERPANFLAQITVLESKGALDSRQAETLRAAALFYRSLDHAIRLVLGRPSAELPEPAQIPRVTALLEKWNVPIRVTLKETVETARESVRAIYNATIREPAG